MEETVKHKLQEALIALGLLIIFVAIFYVIFNNDHPYNKNPKACVNNNYSLGAIGPCVKAGQSLMNWYLYGNEKSKYLNANGVFNAQTQLAVRKTQSGASLDVNGSLDFQTWKLLCSSSATPNWWVRAAKYAGCQ